MGTPPGEVGTVEIVRKDTPKRYSPFLSELNY